MTEKTFLIEIGTEELPSKNLRNLAEAFAANMHAELNKANLMHGKIEWFATPRRLALKVANLTLYQPDHKIKKYGPAITKSFDAEGNPNKIAESWANRCGITLNQADRALTTKGERLVYTSNVKGESTEKLLPKIILNVLEKLPNSNLMRWGVSDSYFIRPVHTITILLGDSVIPAVILGVSSDRIILGHRFMGEKELIINDADQYPQILLERGKVIADYEQRKAKIKIGAEELAYKIGGNIGINDNILEEITSLVEWPVVLSAKFEEKFLAIPIEVLVCIITSNQKCFPVYTDKDNILPNFIFVSNIDSKNPNQIISGNEKVVWSRLADAEFFFNSDLKERLENNVPRLQRVLFKQELGTLRDKTHRLTELSGWIAHKIGANINHAMRAGLLSKCDLLTNMVCEFTNTQGIMGMHYARYNGEKEDVAIALYEQYLPRFSGDILPANPVGCTLAIADKIDTITGILGTGQRPKGDTDPYALRRAALGILRIIVEKNLTLDLQTLTEKTVQLYGKSITNSNTVADVINFIFSRFCAWYKNAGYAMNIIHAVLACRPTRPADFDARIKALAYFSLLEESTALATVSNRILRILAKSPEPLNNIVYRSFLKEKAEIRLADNLLVLHNKLQPYFATGRYKEALIELSTLQEPIDNFFKNIIVNTDDKNLRINRLTLLSKLNDLLLQVANISLLK